MEDSVGDMINSVRKSVKLISIWLGGICCVFKDVCIKLRMIIIWVKLVINISIVGVIFNIVINSIMDREFVFGVFLFLFLIWILMFGIGLVKVIVIDVRLISFIK